MEERARFIRTNNSGSNCGFHLRMKKTDNKNPAENSTMMKTQKPIVCISSMGLIPMAADPIPLFAIIDLARIRMTNGAATHPTRTVTSPNIVLLK